MILGFVPHPGETARWVAAQRTNSRILSPADETAYLSMRNLPTVITNDSGQLNTYDVVWADTIVFTSETLDQVTGAAGYEVSESDFVKDESGSPFEDYEASEDGDG